MLHYFRAVAAALVIGLLVMSHAAPAAASETTDYKREKEVPVIFDAMFLRPLGLAITGMSLALVPIPMGITLITRPTDIMKPVQALVVPPARFTFVDPLGTH
jgi:hypothetical protein